MAKNPCAHLEHLATILDSVADGVFTVDAEMRITSFNRAAEEITGFTRGEALGQPCCEVFRTDLCFSSCPVRQAMRSGRSVTQLEIDILDKSNRELPISVSASVLKDSEGNSIGGVETFRDLSQVHALKREVEGKHAFRDLVSRSPAMRRLFEIVPEVAASPSTVLLQGESGTGKELFARALHDLSPRSQGPLVVVNCGALPESLLEVELFGAKRGAYTGAVEDRTGRLDQAKGGTLFLDEIGDLPLPLQVKLLRVLENREFQPLGAAKTRKADVRFLAATHRDLEAMVRAGSFRQDLYFRLNVIALSIPPLRDRPEDIPLLLEMALDRFTRISAKRVRRFSPKALRVLLDHSYPGNVRELLNVVERAVVLCRGTEIRPEDLPPALGKPGGRVRPKGSPRTQGRQDLADVLARHGGNKAAAARELGVNRTTLWRWMSRP
ncbi:MAG: sigma 54-interacting transcriptional regulator [Deltaproteobacteria bacterium]|nr:sigma 54-interacting transcriptional regulator [Deltaproteobacteria bacterium]